MIFDQIVGHRQIINALETSIREEKVGHAYLFVGAPGIGKKTLAQAFAARLLCGEHAEPNCNCDFCRHFYNGTHPDFLTVIPQGNSIKIEQLRELQHQVLLQSLISNWKVVFFPEAELLTEAASNSFLKILEEPPPRVVFLFAAVRLENILATIRSRCQLYKLFPVSTTEIATWLEKKGYDAQEAATRAFSSQGIPGAALEEEPTNSDEPALIELLNWDLLQLLKKANEFEKKERVEVLNILENWRMELRRQLIGWTQLRPEKSEQLLNILAELDKIIMMINHNVNQRLAMEVFFISFKIE